MPLDGVVRLVLQLLLAPGGNQPGASILGHDDRVSNQTPEAAAIAEAAMGLAGQRLHPFTRELIEALCRGEVTGDQAVLAIVARFVT